MKSDRSERQNEDEAEYHREKHDEETRGGSNGVRCETQRHKSNGTTYEHDDKCEWHRARHTIGENLAAKYVEQKEAPKQWHRTSSDETREAQGAHSADKISKGGENGEAGHRNRCQDYQRQAVKSEEAESSQGRQDIARIKYWADASEESSQPEPETLWQQARAATTKPKEVKQETSGPHCSKGQRHTSSKEWKSNVDQGNEGRCGERRHDRRTAYRHDTTRVKSREDESGDSSGEPPLTEWQQVNAAALNGAQSRSFAERVDRMLRQTPEKQKQQRLRMMREWPQAVLLRLAESLCSSDTMQQGRALEHGFSHEN